MSANPRNLLRKIKPDLEDFQLSQLVRYVELVREYNQRVNLISRSDVNHIWEHHILPSIVALRVVDIAFGANLIDVGTGAGLPGIPLKILRPDLNIVLVDSIRKKTLFLRKVITELSLKKAAVLNFRMEPDEDIYQLWGKFNIATVRAVSSFDVLYGLLRPLLQPAGFILAWKGDSDMPKLKRAASKLNFSYEAYTIPEEFRNVSQRLAFLRLCKLFNRD